MGLEQEACGLRSRLLAWAGGVWLEQQACNRLEQDTLAGGEGVWLEQEEQEACG